MPYLTYFDLVEGLIVSSFGGPQDAEQRDIRTAIHRAYDELTTIRDWSYYHVHGRVTTTAPYSTGTVQITSGTVTLTNGSFSTAGMNATNAKHWTLKVGDRVYPVREYDGTTTIYLMGDFSSYDVSAGTAYTLYRTIYPLPSDFRNMDEPSDEYNWWSGIYVTPDQAMKLERASNTSGAPLHWTIIKDPETTDWAIKLMGYPTEKETIDFTYRRTARPIRYSGHESSSRAGTISRAGATVTGSGTSFQEAMEGAILRVGDTTNHPGPIESITPWVSETKIISAPTTTGFTTAATGTIAASTKYIITDPIDVAQHMHKAMDSCCDYWLARIRGTGEDRAFSLYQRDLRLAMEQDQLAPLSGRSGQVWHYGGWRSQLLADEG